MDIFIIAVIVMTLCFGLVPAVVEAMYRSKGLRRKLAQDEQKAIIEIILGFKPLAAGPDVKDTKKGIIDAINKRSAR